MIDAFLKGDKKPTESQAETTQISRKKPTVYKKHEDRRTCGPPISFRNLVCEPINEQGVVFLFGMVCQELGFSAIEYIGIDFPDCEGKRLVSKGSRQQTVKIEFEYESKEFEKHCHDAQNCDLIVCWKHNWKKCPIEVIELSQVIKELSPAKR